MYSVESRIRCGEEGTSSGPSSENPASSKSSQNASTFASLVLRGRITACTTVGGLSSGMRENRRSQRLTIAAVVVAEIPRARWLLQVIRSPRGYRLFILWRVAGELLGLQITRPRPGGHIDTSTHGLAQGTTYLCYEILRRPPR